jgi:UDP-N-acetylglucosamine 2-epimerase (non-hydrolysing)
MTADIKLLDCINAGSGEVYGNQASNSIAASTKTLGNGGYLNSEPPFSPAARCVAVVAGTRPEVIKLAPVASALVEAGCNVKWFFTAQQERGDQAIRDMGVVLDASLSWSDAARSLRADFRHMQTALVRWLTSVQADQRAVTVLVQGDTLSTLAGGRAASVAGCELWHLEAGLRSYEPRKPFQEEIIRRLLSRWAHRHFAPSAIAARALEVEGVDIRAVFVVGNPALETLNVDANASMGLLVTLHRRESMSATLRDFLSVLLDVAARYIDKRFYFIRHTIPGVREALASLGRTHHLLNWTIGAPLPRRDFLNKLASAGLVVTDSGGVQEEAAALGKRTLSGA